METTRPSLLERVKNRSDDHAWSEFHALYAGLIRRYARVRGLGHEEAEDIAATCMEQLVTHVGEFVYDPDKGRFRGWLRRIVNNKITDQQRRRRPRPMDTSIFQEAEDSELGPAYVWEQNWRKAHLAHCLASVRSTVPTTQFEAFRLYAIEERPADAVASELQITVNQVYQAKSRIMARLREAMVELLGDDGDIS